MPITPLFLILAAIIGLLIGLLVASLFSSREPKNSELAATPPELAKDGYAEAARLWYSPVGDKIITELDGGLYRDYLTLSPEQKTRVNRFLESWMEWTGKSIDSTPAVRVIQNMSDLLPIPTSENTPPPQPVLDWSVSAAMRERDMDEAGEKLNDMASKTVAGQISAIIDRMLEGNPLRDKGIRLIENNQHGVDVWIGLEKFDGIDAIPYPEVQGLIRQAAAQWEKESELKNNKQ